MSHAIHIRIGGVSLASVLNDSPTASAIVAALPICASAHRWGDEIYFGIAVQEDRDPNARTEMEVGELGYWPPGKAFCIFFGPTPASTDDQPRAASAVNRIGRVLDDVAPLRNVPDGTEVRIEHGQLPQV